MSRRGSRSLLIILGILFSGAAASGQDMFWEAPQVVEARGVKFSQSASGGGLAVIAWQELVSRGGGRGDIYVRLVTTRDGVQWSRGQRVFGPIPYSSASPELQPPVYSMIVDARGRILIAAAVSENITAILVSEDGGATFTQTARLESTFASVTPNLFAASGGRFLLFVTQSVKRTGGTGVVEDEFLSLFSSSSPDGRTWSGLTPFVAEADLRYNFLPSHAAFKGRDFVVFQSRSEANTYQLYVKSSGDGGASWDAARPITLSADFAESVESKVYEPKDFTNQRPYLAMVGDALGMVWERNVFGSKTQIYYCELDEKGSVASGKEKVTTSSRGSYYAQLLLYKGSVYVLYTDNPLAKPVISLALRRGIWTPQVLSSQSSGTASTPHAVLFKDRLLVFWESSGGLVALRPVTEASPPQLVAVDFTPGTTSNRSSVSVQWKDPPDPSGIREYAYTWSLNGKARLEKTISQSNPTVILPADEDGEWQLSVTALDFAGNRSAPARIGFTRDATPPAAVRIEPLKTDDNGYLVSNSYTLSWSPGPGKQVAGYSYLKSFLGTDEQEAQAALAALPLPPAKVNTTGHSVSYENEDNGIYAITILPIDSTGNMGEPVRVVLKLDKFLPFTAVYRVDRKADLLGNVTLAIAGRGFTTDGLVDSITLGASEAPPFDYTFSRAKGEFTVVDDRHIQGPLLNAEMKSGRYVLGMRHAARGWFFWKGGAIVFETPGTIKIGDYRIRYLPGWFTSRVPRFTIPTSQLIVIAVLLLIAVLLVVSARSMVSVAREGAMLREEVAALIEGRPSRGRIERKEEMQKLQKLQKRGAGLRLKFTLLIVALVFLVVLGVAIPLSLNMISTQRSTLAAGLKDRAGILIGSITSAAEIQLRRGENGYADISDVPIAYKNMPEAQYATVTGPGNTAKGAEPGYMDYVWASTEKKWQDKFQAGQFRVAEEKEQDALSAEVLQKFQSEVAQEARQKAGAQVDDILGSLGRYVELSVKTDRRSQDEANAALSRYTQGGKAVDSALKSFSSSLIKSYPDFSADSLAPQYTFYMPVVYLSSKKDASGAPARDSSGSYQVGYYQGLVRLVVSTERISSEIQRAQRTLIIISGTIALIAIGLGILGAFLLANIILNPIKKLAAGVRLIGETEDKEELKGKDIVVNTKDEIGQLANQVNEMMHGLIKAAAANKLLMAGKEVQRMFLPVKDEQGRTGLYARQKVENNKPDPNVEIFGYYEGAKGVSGDYFDFRKLDETHYAMIKCDVSGKGVPAAIIMVEVATLFIRHFEDWKKNRPILLKIADKKERIRRLQELERIDTLVYQINDMVEARGFKGKFAALTICLLNTETGILTVCNAGDTEMHFYEKELGRVEKKTLPNSPASGVFPSDLVEMKSPFRQVPQRMDPGDVLFLFTDGFEESNHLFRNERLESLGPEDYEQFGIERIHEIINAVYSKGSYTLVRKNVPDQQEKLDFDFSSCEATARSAVLALVGVEKIFRLYLDPSKTDPNKEDQKVAVDAEIDTFLKEHFLQYQQFFSHPAGPGKEPNSITFTHLLQDEQYDDLTLLVVRKM
jgi:serine phosphatase RsbU (regulator of sigma subunit)